MLLVRILLILILVAAVLFLALLPVMIRDGSRFVTREYVISSDKISKEHTFVFISDLHEKVYEPDNEPIVRAVDRLHPEMVIVGGDMITGTHVNPGDLDAAWCRRALSLLERIGEKYPIFLCNGNHELKLLDPDYAGRFGDAYGQYMRELQKIGLRVRRNESEELPGDPDVVLWSFEADHDKFDRFGDHNIDGAYVAERLPNPDPSKFNIVVTHHPRHFDACAFWGADLVLAGHIHGGILRLPKVGGIVSPDPQLFPHYSGGRYEISFDAEGKVTGRSGRVFDSAKTPAVPQGGRKSVMVLSCGIGFHTIPIRIFNPAELSLIRLEPAWKKNHS